MKTKDKYISISNILHLLSAPVSITRVGTIWDSLVVTSKSYCKFILASNFCLIVDSSFHPSRALTRSFEVSNPSTWTYFCYILGVLTVFHSADVSCTSTVKRGHSIHLPLVAYKLYVNCKSWMFHTSPMKRG